MWWLLAILSHVCFVCADKNQFFQMINHHQTKPSPDFHMSFRDYRKSVEIAFPKHIKIVRARPYQMPKGYVPWNRLAFSIAEHIGEAKEEFDRFRESPNVEESISSIMKRWFYKDAPLYCLPKELLKDFQNADLSNVLNLLEDFEEGLPPFLVALPENAMKTRTGKPITALLVHASHYPESGRIRTIYTAAIESSGSMLAGRVKFSEDGRICSSTGKALNITELDFDNDSGDSRMRKVGIQCMLAIAYSPELLSDKENSKVETKFTARHKSRSQPPVRRPRWFRSQQVSSSPPRPHQGGSHASPRPHWRSAHKKRVAIGPRGSGEYKVVKIKPTWVNPAVPPEITNEPSEPLIGSREDTADMSQLSESLREVKDLLKKIGEREVKGNRFHVEDKERGGVKISVVAASERLIESDEVGNVQRNSFSRDDVLALEKSIDLMKDLIASQQPCVAKETSSKVSQIEI